MKSLCKFFSIFFISLSVFLGGQDQLQPSDVQKIMQQIFAQHVDKKEISATILKNSFRVYFDQFDPSRIYLLEQEVQPYLNLTDGDMQKIVEQYKNNQFPEYQQINDTIQKAILRARQIRAQLYQNKDQILQDSKDLNLIGNEDWSDPDLSRSFAKDLASLKIRIQQQLTRFIAQERIRYGEQEVAKYESHTLTLFEKHLQANENHYLFMTESGNPMTESQKQNLFVMHILKSLASSLDAHTSFYDSTEAYDMRVRLEKEFQGVGIVLKKGDDGEYRVTRLIEGSAAVKSGMIQVDDRIVKIDGKALKNEPIDKVSDLLKGKNGTKVALVVTRSVQNEGKKIDKTFNVELTRAPIIIQEDRVDISYVPFGNGIIGKLTLHAFYQGEDNVSSEEDLRNAIKKLQKIGNLRGLILDLRENSGGFLSQAIKVTGLFISNGIVVISKYFNGEERVYRDIEGKTAYDGPLVVLTSKATASAAEIVAQALQDYGVAIIVGDEHTYGKGTIQSQTITDNQGSAYFKVTVGKYYTVSGKTPQIQGVKSDIIVPGEFNGENLGEEYLEYAMGQDKIAPMYSDSLKDVDPNLKSWYLHYYVPTIQHKTVFWDDMLPILRRNSQYRMVHNREYQIFLNSRSNPYLARQSKEINVSDIQMAEAVNIVKDMIAIQTRLRGMPPTETVKKLSGHENQGIPQEIQKD